MRIRRLVPKKMKDGGNINLGKLEEKGERGVVAIPIQRCIVTSRGGGLGSLGKDRGVPPSTVPTQSKRSPVQSSEKHKDRRGARQG